MSKKRVLEILEYPLLIELAARARRSAKLRYVFVWFLHAPEKEYKS
jgi:hypothetical protein